MVTAKGIKYAKELVVRYENKKFTFNNEENKALLFELESILKENFPVFGTYCADNVYDELYILGVLKERFFDKEPEIISDENLQVDWENEVY